MFDLIFLILLGVFFTKSFVYNNKPTSKIIIRRNGEFYKTLLPFEYTFINPFTDTIEFKEIELDELPNNDSKRINKTFNETVPTYSLDNKAILIYAKGSYNFYSPIGLPFSSEVEEIIFKVISEYFKKRNYSSSITRLNLDELSILDTLREKLKPLDATIKSFEISFTPFNENFKKVECIHYNENSTSSTRKRKILNLNEEAITGLDENLESPIKESSSITSSLLNTLNNMDYNIDPINNKK